MIRRMASRGCGIVSFALAITTVPLLAQAGTLVAEKDVALCRSLSELEAFEARRAAEDKLGIELYLKGAQPPCILLAAGDAVEQLDHNGIHIQVVTRKGVPRFIGWGQEASFRKP
jgi:hypothetical protein